MPFDFCLTAETGATGPNSSGMKRSDAAAAAARMCLFSAEVMQTMCH